MPVAGFNRPGDGANGLKIVDKLNLVANLVAKGQNATANDSISTLISKILNLGNVGSFRKATGSVVSDGGNLMAINNLAFTPLIVFIYQYAEWYFAINPYALGLDTTTSNKLDGGFLYNSSYGGNRLTLNQAGFSGTNLSSPFKAYKFIALGV